MKPITKIISVLTSVIILSSCTPTATPSNQITDQPTTISQITWKTYTNKELGFSIDVPEKVSTKYDASSNLLPLNIYESDNKVYFSTGSLEAADSESMYDFLIHGGTASNDEQIAAFFKKAYNAQGCKFEINQDSQTGYYSIIPSAQSENLMPDDPNSCFIAGKLRTFYDKTSGKILSYQLTQPFFYLPEGSQEEKALASLKFQP